MFDFEFVINGSYFKWMYNVIDKVFSLNSSNQKEKDKGLVSSALQTK